MASKDYILIVDPDRELVTALEALLKNEGFETVSAFDGKSALDKCEKELPRIVILEGLIPKINGIDLAKKIRGLPDGGLVSILLMSAVFTGAKFRPQIKEAQIDDVLPKPFLSMDLVDKIRAFEVQRQKVKIYEKTSTPPVAFPHTGYLTETPFIRLVFHICSEKLTGTLRLQNASAKKLVTFESGEPKFVVSNLERECLGQILVKKGRLTEQQCTASLSKMVELKKRQGETLIQMGLLKPFELEENLKAQAREKLCEIFGWRQGQYLFVPGKVFKKELTPVDLSIEQLCLRGVKEHYNLPLLQEVLATHLENIPQFVAQDKFRLENFKFATWDMKVVQLIKRKDSLGRILETKIARELDVYHLFYTLFMLGLIEFKSVEEVGVSPPQREAQQPSAISPFDLLGISARASDEDIRKAFETRMLALKDKPHSDMQIPVLRAAYEKIATLQGRRDFLMRSYEAGGNCPMEAKDVFRVEEFIEVGKRLVEKRAFENAKKVFMDGIRMYPEEGLCFSYLGYTIFTELFQSTDLNAEDRDKAKKMMMKGVQLAPDKAETRYLLGRCLSLDKDYGQAVVELQKALELNPKHPQAASELRVAQMRMDKQRKNTSFIRWKK